MSSELVPAAIALGGGAALASGIYLHERRLEDAMRASRQSLGLRFPMALRPDSAEAAVAALAGLAESSELIFEITASETGVAHGLQVPVSVRRTTLAALTGAIPSLRTVDPSDQGQPATVSLAIFLPTPICLRTDEVVASSRGLLTGLTGLLVGEHIAIRWALRPSRAPRLSGRSQSEPTELTRAWTKKATRPGFRIAGLVLVRASSVGRARLLAEQVAATYRARRMGRVGLCTTVGRGHRTLAALPRVTRSSGWLTAAELLPLLAFPLGPDAVPGVEVGASRELPVPRQVARNGRQLLVGRDSSGERPVALTPEAALHHVAITGASGSGKSVVLARGVLDDLAAGYAGVVLDPKADLIQTILERVPAADASRVVVLDPADPGPTVGLNVMSGAGDPDLRADVLLGAFRSIFSDSWGVRSESYGRFALRTLAELPGATLSDFGRIFFDDEFRRRALARVDDPVLHSAWQTYESLSPAEQAQHVGAPVSKVVSLIERPVVRAVLAQPTPKLDVAELLASGRLLLVSLAPGRLGEPASRLLGAIVLYLVWSAVEARVSLRPAERRGLFIYIDELASIASLPFGLEALAERARGLGAGLTIATQTLGRLPESVRASLLGNVATLVAFRAGADEAARLARELPGLTAADIQSLGQFEVAARIGTGLGSGVSVVTGRTNALPPPTGQAASIRVRSQRRYGMTAAEVSRHTSASSADEPQIGRRRRRP